MSGTSREPIGWIGCGVMGQSMCGHLLDAGHFALETDGPEIARHMRAFLATHVTAKITDR